MVTDFLRMGIEKEVRETVESGWRMVFCIRTGPGGKSGRVLLKYSGVLRIVQVFTAQKYLMTWQLTRLMLYLIHFLKDTYWHDMDDDTCDKRGT